MMYIWVWPLVLCDKIGTPHRLLKETKIQTIPIYDYSILFRNGISECNLKERWKIALDRF